MHVIMHAIIQMGGENLAEKTIAVRIDEKLYKEIKLRLAENGMTLKKYIITLIENDIEDSKRLNSKAVPLDNTINQESIKEVQKILDFIKNITSDSYSNKKD